MYGLNLTLELIKQDRNPVWVLPPHLLDVDNATKAALKSGSATPKSSCRFTRKNRVLEFDFPALHSLRNDFLPSLEDQIVQGSRNIGVIFFENTDFSSAGLARAQKYDLIITGSTWNKERLQAYGLTHVVNVFQGIDDTLFRTDNEAIGYPGRFVIFSGGKLEYRKSAGCCHRRFPRISEDTRGRLITLCLG